MKKKKSQKTRGVYHDLTSDERDRGRETQGKHLTMGVEFPVVSYKDCEREDVLKFCLDQLKAGVTYNELRMKVGLGPTHLDGRWRKLRRILSDMILPANEEEALLAGYSSTQYVIKKMEMYLEKLGERLQTAQNTADENEHQYWKLELEAMKAIIEKQEKRTDHYLKMKDLQKAEKGRRGSTIIFQNNYSIPRPGETPKDVTPLSDAAALVGKIHALEDEGE